MPCTYQQISETISQLTYKDWKFHLSFGTVIWLQVRFRAEDNDHPGHSEWQHGRKWIISTHMTKSEIVQTALKAVLTAEEHEAREQFHYRGRAVFAPHLDVDELYHKADGEHIDVRAPMISREALDNIAETRNIHDPLPGQAPGEAKNYTHTGTDLGADPDKSVTTRITDNRNEEHKSHA